MYKRVFISLLGFGFCAGCHPQSIIDTVSYRFVYDVQAKTYEINDRLFPDEHWLDVGKNGVSKYYSMWKERYWEVNDSIKQIGGNYMDIQRVVHEQGIESSQFYYYVYKNYPSTGKQTIDYHSMEVLQYEEPMGQDWELVEGDTIILEHPCQKAVCHYHDKTWTAFYATDIPIAEGPWKLCGLPGLILRAYDSNGAFLFHCIGIHPNVGKPMAIRETPRRRMKPEQAHKLIELIDKYKCPWLLSVRITSIILQNKDERNAVDDIAVPAGTDYVWPECLFRSRGSRRFKEKYRLGKRRGRGQGT